MAKKKKNSVKLDQLEKKNIFSVPEHYFSSISTQPEGKLVAQKILLSKNIYQVPEAYFEKLPLAISSKIAKEKILTNEKIRENVFEVPALYFDRLAGYIVNRISSEKILTSKDPKHSLYEVPEGYFDSLPYKIQERIAERKKGWLPQTEFIPALKPAFSYAMAAAIAGILILFGLNYFSPFGENQLAKVAQEQPSVIQAEKLIAGLSKKEIHTYLESQEGIETSDLIEVSSKGKKDKIEKEFEQYVLPEKLKKKEKQDIEIEIEDIDIQDLELEI